MGSIKSRVFPLSFITLVLFICFTSYLKAGDNVNIFILKKDISSNQYHNYNNSLSSLGLKVKEITLDGSDAYLAKSCVLIIPSDIAIRLSKKETSRISKAVKGGMSLVTEGNSLLAKELGISFTNEFYRIHSVHDRNHPDVAICWTDTLNAQKIESKGVAVLCKDPKHNSPVMVSLKPGKGRLIYLNVPFDNPRAFGYGRFPYFHEYFTSVFRVKPYIKRNKLMAYLDIGYHESEDLGQLAFRMKTYGINEVHISAWYSPESYGSKYRTLIEECHRNGILVYAWLELPMVTEEFWNEHPAWREKTALGKDAAVDWRKLMALEVPECFEAVTSFLKHLIMEMDWDGIDLAEFYFDSLDGLKIPGALTPMSDFVRNDFKGTYGFDPAEIFNPSSEHYFGSSNASYEKYLSYRVKLCTGLNRKVLQFFRDQKLENSYDVYLTQIANPSDEKLNRNIGVDINEFIKLQKEFNFTMQAEDPFPLWVLGPDRYKTIGNEYRNLLGNDVTLTIDINIVSEGRDDPFPTKMQTGLEFTQLLYQASQNVDRVCIYAVNTAYPYDFKYAPYALSSKCRADKLPGNEYKSDSPVSFMLETEQEIQKVILNGEEWPCRGSDYVLLPSGKNRVKLIKDKPGINPKICINDLSCEIGKCSYSGNDIQISYKENRKVLITLSKKPGMVYVDNEKKDLAIIHNSRTNQYVVKCPRGSHTILFSSR